MPLLTANTAIFSYVQPSGTPGGSRAQYTWETLPLNTTVVNNCSNASLLNNEITLGEGSYEIKIITPAQLVSNTQMRLLIQNPPNPDETIPGNTTYSAEYQTTLINGSFVLEIPSTETRTLQIQQWSNLPSINEGGGIACDCDGVNEIYTQILIKELIYTDPEYVNVNINEMIVRFEMPNGSAPGMLSNGAWYSRSLNTTIANNIIGADLNPYNHIELPAGIYLFEAYAPGNRVDAHKIRLYDYTNNVVVLESMNAFSHSNLTNGVGTMAIVEGVYELTNTAEIGMEHQCQTTNTLSTAKGNAVSNVDPTIEELYETIKVTKIS